MTPVKTASTIAFQASPSRFSSSSLIGLMVCLLLGLAYAGWLLPVGFIEGTHPYWRAQNEDTAVYQAGFNAFFREPWQWPLWRITSLNWPQGTAATFVDILPLYSALLKLLAPASWFPFNPFGAWVLLCIIMQALGAWWVLREAEVRDWLALVVLVLLLISLPTWLRRMGHISLMSHWMITFGYAIFLRSLRLDRFSGLCWLLLLTSGVMLNIYLFAMASIICLADALRCISRGDLRRVLGWALATCALLTGAVWLTLWPLPPNTGQPDTGFGLYSMNLLSPISGIDAKGLGGRWINPQGVANEQLFEGFNYLGVGIILLALIAFAASLRQPWPKRFTRSSWILAPCLLLVAVYALSNQIYFGKQLVAQWSVPAWAGGLTGTFRASGRFFWLVSYAVVIFSVIGVYRLLPRRWAHGVIVITLVLQMIDLRPYVHEVRYLQPKADALVIDTAAWNKTIPPSTTTLYYFPKFKCAKRSDFFKTLLPVMQLASARKLNINTAYIARYTPECDSEARDIAASDPLTSVYVFAREDYSAEAIRGFFPIDWPMQCRDEDFAVICQPAPRPALLH